MSKIEITRTELVWPGKYDENGELVPPRRVNLPFQVIERVNETRATRQQKEELRAGHVATLFDYWQADKGKMADPGDIWRNKLIWGDNLYVMGSLLESFAGKIDLLYIDPPFATGVDFSVKAQIGDEEITKEQSIVEEKAYRDTWAKGLDTYLAMMYDRLHLLKELLSPRGTIFIHIDWTIGHYLKTVADEIFGKEYFRNEIIWYYTNKLGTGGNTFDKHHDNLLVYVKGNKWTHNPIMRPVKKQKLQPVTKKIEGKRIWLRDENGNRIYAMGKSEVKVGDVWDVPYINPVANERLGYQTQKPEALLDYVISASSNEGDLVADLFCGSGTTLAISEKLGRRWIGCDLSRYAIHTTRKRLMDIEGCLPFEILNLGQYERQVWQGIIFAGKKQTQQMLIFEYLKFILELYGAQPLACAQHLHGKKGSALVHIGAVDTPVTIDEINACLAECKEMKQKELHVLGWEWEMGLANIMIDEAKARGVKLLLLTIPREVMEQQAVDKGDIHFYELAYLETDIQVKGREATVELTDFIIPNDELIPPEVRQKIKKWSDYADYWAVDWDFQFDTFINQWTSYRTRRDRGLKLKTEPHEYPESGAYRILVKVIDIFGNDTSQAFTVEVK